MSRFPTTVRRPDDAEDDQWRNSLPSHNDHPGNGGHAVVPGRPRLWRPSPPNEPELPKDVNSRFGRRLRELRHERALTQLGMARKFGIDRSYISDVERGRKSISLPILEVISLGLEISLSELFRDI